MTNTKEKCNKEGIVTVLRRPAVWPDAQLLESATVDLASAKLGYRLSNLA